MSIGEMFELEAELVTETDRAYRINDGATRCWLPKSQVGMRDEKRKGSKLYATFAIPEWLAKEKGLV